MKTFIILCILMPSYTLVSAQHEHHVHKDQMPKDEPKHMMKDTTMQHSKNKMNEEAMMAPMSHSFSMSLPMERDGSGTGWMPDDAPMYGIMMMKPKWMHMLHYNLFLRYNNQDVTDQGSRGEDDFDIPSWFMLMGQTHWGERNLFHYSAMISLDPFLVGESGYPLLFQTGETYKGRPLVDRQHPHDLFSELSVSLTHSFSATSDLFVYLGYPGEPALGPVAFMHRASALDNPNSPLNHHWLDATHITFGVATLGYRLGKVKFEYSVFTGREPDEDRYDLDSPKFDSWSGRFSLNPNPHWALQVSHGFLNSPEALHPEEDIYRTTASAIYSISLDDHHSINSTLAWGMNSSPDQPQQNAFLAEGAYRMNKFTLFARYDFTQKSSLELDLNEQFQPDDIFNIHSFTIGGNIDIVSWEDLTVAPGLNLTINKADERLSNLYGDTPIGFQAYVRLYPGRVNH